MRKLNKALRIAAVIAAVGAGTIAVTGTPAFASGCSGKYTDGGRSYVGGPCTGYPSYYHLHAAGTCKPNSSSGTAYSISGGRAPISGQSKFTCLSGYYAIGHVVVEDN